MKRPQYGLFNPHSEKPNKKSFFNTNFQPKRYCSHKQQTNTPSVSKPIVNATPFPTKTQTQSPHSIPLQSTHKFVYTQSPPKSFPKQQKKRYILSQEEEYKLLNTETFKTPTKQLTSPTKHIHSSSPLNISTTTKIENKLECPTIAKTTVLPNSQKLKTHQETINFQQNSNCCSSNDLNVTTSDRITTEYPIINKDLIPSRQPKSSLDQIFVDNDGSESSDSDRTSKTEERLKNTIEKMEREINNDNSLKSSQNTQELEMSVDEELDQSSRKFSSQNKQIQKDAEMDEVLPSSNEYQQKQSISNQINTDFEEMESIYHERQMSVDEIEPMKEEPNSFTRLIERQSEPFYDYKSKSGEEYSNSGCMYSFGKPCTSQWTVISPGNLIEDGHSFFAIEQTNITNKRERIINVTRSKLLNNEPPLLLIQQSNDVSLTQRRNSLPQSAHMLFKQNEEKIKEMAKIKIPLADIIINFTCTNTEFIEFRGSFIKEIEMLEDALDGEINVIIGDGKTEIIVIFNKNTYSLLNLNDIKIRARYIRDYYSKTSEIFPIYRFDCTML
ncbi:hypothetical protein QTN25_001465 [Entamoeba marina]